MSTNSVLGACKGIHGRATGTFLNFLDFLQHDWKSGHARPWGFWKRSHQSFVLLLWALSVSDWWWLSKSLLYSAASLAESGSCVYLTETAGIPETPDTHREDTASLLFPYSCPSLLPTLGDFFPSFLQVWRGSCQSGFYSPPDSDGSSAPRRDVQWLLLHWHWWGLHWHWWGGGQCLLKVRGQKAPVGGRNYVHVIGTDGGDEWGAATGVEKRMHLFQEPNLFPFQSNSWRSWGKPPIWAVVMIGKISWAIIPLSEMYKFPFPSGIFPGTFEFQFGCLWNVCMFCAAKIMCV